MWGKTRQNGKRGLILWLHMLKRTARSKVFRYIHTFDKKKTIISAPTASSLTARKNYSCCRHWGPEADYSSWTPTRPGRPSKRVCSTPCNNGSLIHLIVSTANHRRCSGPPSSRQPDVNLGLLSLKIKIMANGNISMRRGFYDSCFSLPAVLVILLESSSSVAFCRLLARSRSQIRVWVLQISYGRLHSREGDVSGTRITQNDNVRSLVLLLCSQGWWGWRCEDPDINLYEPPTKPYRVKHYSASHN